MLFPQSNEYRQVLDISGFWDFKPDPEKKGIGLGWPAGFGEGRPIAVPGSWNSQLDDVRQFLGQAWYQTRFHRPWGWQDKRAMLRFGSVNYLAEVWLNGELLGTHEGGHLPFEFDVTRFLRQEGNLVVVRVDAELAPDRIPPGNVPADLSDRIHNPASRFDFFPFAGIHRPVLLYATSREAIADIAVETEIDGNSGTLRLRVKGLSDESAILRARVSGHGADVRAETKLGGPCTEIFLRVPDAALWSPEAPNLYELGVELARGASTIDRYSVNIGIRTVKVDGDRLLLNGKPLYLRGFGRHEDFMVVGRGYMPALVIKDFELMRWSGANSFRTTHYPYSEQMMDLADRLGYLVIDETPAVGMFFEGEGLERRMAIWKEQTRELIARDLNHPSVVMWSIANEPGDSTRPEARSHFQEVFSLARSLDPTRPLTFANHLGITDTGLEFCDVVCLNRYRGWYLDKGKVEEGVRALSKELDEMHAAFPRPMIITEFGADAVAGLHTEPPEMFSEEYQLQMIEAYIDLFREKAYVVGEHVWNLCDFKAAQDTGRVGAMNLKGVFTQDRRPKMAAHRLRELWRSPQREVPSY